MFDMENQEAIMKLINERDENCYVIPLYVHINNQRYNLWEMNEITDFSPHTIKVGFGSSQGLMVRFPFPSKCMFEFDMIRIFHRYDYDRDVETFYHVFESGFLSDEELKDEMHQQIQAYVNAISEHVMKHVNEKRQEVRKQMMEDEDNYINIVSE